MTRIFHAMDVHWTDTKHPRKCIANNISATWGVLLVLGNAASVIKYFDKIELIPGNQPLIGNKLHGSLCFITRIERTFQINLPGLLASGFINQNPNNKDTLKENDNNGDLLL